MLPFLVLSAMGAGFGAFICVLRNVMFQAIMTSIALQVLGLGLMSTLPIFGDVPARQYGFQAILGFGFGISLSVLPLITRVQVGLHDHGQLPGFQPYCSLSRVLINRRI